MNIRRSWSTWEADYRNEAIMKENTMEQTKLLDRRYGGKRLGDMTLDEVEQALRDVRNDVKQLERDAVNEAKTQSRDLRDDDAEQTLRDLFVARGVADANADGFFLEKIIEEFSKQYISVEDLFTYWPPEPTDEKPPGVAKIFTRRS
jgi:hypothetical protein